MGALGPVLRNRYSQLEGTGTKAYTSPKCLRISPKFSSSDRQRGYLFTRPADITHPEEDSRQSGDDLDSREHYIETQIETDNSVRDTEGRLSSERGQGLLNQRVSAIES